MNYSFSQLVNLDELQSLCEQFTGLTGFVTAILDMEGNVLVATGWREICTCFHRSAPETALKCRESDTVLADRIDKGQKYCVYRCANGLIDVAVPIVVDNEQVGRLYSGQFLFAPPDMEFFRRQAAESGFDESTYLDAVSRVPVVTEERVRMVMGFLSRLAEMIGEMGLTNKRVEEVSLIAKTSPAVLFSWGASEGWPIEFVSENVVQFGYEQEELISWEVPYAAMLHPEDLERVVGEMEECALRGVDNLQLEYRIICKGGEVRWVAERAVAERDASGEVRHYRGVVLDISERKRAEEALRVSEQRYRNIVENAPVGIFRSTMEGKFLAANPALAHMLGHDSPEDLLQAINRSSAAEVIYLEPGRRTGVILKSLGSPRWHICEEPFRRKDGSIALFNIYHRVVPDSCDGSIEFEGFCEDITERKLAERALLLTQYCVDNASIGISISDLGRIFQVNGYLCRILGYSRDELTSMSIRDIDAFFSPEELEKVFEKIHTDAGFTFDTLHRRRDGTTLPVEITATLLNFDGRDIVVSFSRDITERRQAEQALRESEERLRLSLAAAKQAFYDIDVKSGTAQLSPEFPLMMGYQPEEYLPTLDNLWEHMHPDDREQVFRAYVSSVEGVASDFTAEYRHRTRDGGWKWVLSLGKVMERDADGMALRMLGTATDISDRKMTEERIQASLAEKTVLLKEVHHRVKNNLQIICSLLDLQSDSVPDERSRIYFRDSQDRIRTMAFVHELLYQSSDLASIDFGEYIQRLVAYLFNSYVKDVKRISLNIMTDSLSLGIDRAIPSGLILNELVSNSLKHAFPGDCDGSITIELGIDRDGVVTIVVADDGVGFPGEVDFANTPTLGLQLVNMLVKQLRGRIELARDGGARFTIRFSGETTGRAFRDN